MRDIPVVLDGYKLTVVEPPAPKMREDGNGGWLPVTNRDGVTQFVVSLFAKLRTAPGQRPQKGEEIKVTLETDPGEGFGEDSRVALVNARINAYQIDSPDGRSISGISFKALSLAPAGLAPAPRGEK
ncbi:hypothetical protein GCM10017691_01140 [Pseudonocardia petroleophila]|uniref:Uncharacterized protein n=1 Tax=Pseudonocardia petroleophila TaxID=37331 RepID=A0A7G7MLC7_9PSEU|nr:hypothetical protein [Pseudonocardia petroleophila]QNG53588.1 hypothetical protein H6H00_06425 [Pseudonocardia petroleophila]